MSKRLTGMVQSGFGLATSSLAPLHTALCRQSRLALVEGTLNVRLGEPYVVVPDFILDETTYRYHETLLVQHCRIEETPGIIVRTSTQARGDSHPLDVIEILSTVRLRSVFGLEDGDRVNVEVSRSL